MAVILEAVFAEKESAPVVVGSPYNALPVTAIFCVIAPLLAFEIFPENVPGVAAFNRV